MFDVGFQEITLIGVIALIVVGPERLPKMARTVGLWMGKIRYYVGQVKSDIEREVRAQELKEMLDKPARELDDLYKVAEETKGTLDQAKGALGEAKAALESGPASISTPNEPASGSIFPTELPAPSAEPALAGPPPDTQGTGSTEAPAATDTPDSGSTEAVPVATNAPGTGSTETAPAAMAPMETDTPDSGSTETAPVATNAQGTGSTETAPAAMAPTETDTPDTESTETTPVAPDTPGAGSTETAPAQAGAEKAALAEAEPREHGTVPVTTDVGENDERSSGRI